MINPESFIAPIFSTSASFAKWLGDKEAQKRMLVVECLHNLQLIRMIKANSGAEFRNHILKNLECQSAEMIIAFSNPAGYKTVDKASIKSLKYFKNIKDILNQKGEELSIEEDEKKEFVTIKDENLEKRLVSMICSIKGLKVLGGLPNKLKDEAKVKYNYRIENLRKILLGILINFKAIDITKK